MSALLRRPNIVPSLFSACDDQDGPAEVRPRAARFAERLEACFMVIDEKPGEPVMGPLVRGLAGTCIVLILMGKPLMIASLLLVGRALAR